MSNRCSAELLELALAGNLPVDREELLHHHLEECEACSAAIEQMAGGATWCREAAALLIRDELDDAVPSRDEWSNVDFTVEHLEPSDEPNVLGKLGGYDVLEIIGRGGMGVVLKGFDRELKRCVAIKVLSPHLAQSSLAKKRFAREAQAAAAVVHPNVLAIHQVQSGGQLPFLVMPLVAGESLAGRLVAQGRLELKETLRIGMQAAAGLAAAHEQGLVHRDVKPANILLEKGVERAVLTDFGLARAADDVSMTRWGIIAGTPQYMSPEQAQGEPLDGRSDLFSLGCVLYEMATGVSPFRADSTMATLRRLIDDAPPTMASLNPELPPWFIGIVDRLLEKDPSRRFGSAKEVSELMEDCLAHLQQPTSVPLPAAIPAPAARPVSRLRKHLLKGTTIMFATLGMSLLGMFAMQATEPPDIAGRWSSEGAGQIVLTQTAVGEYAGTYSTTVGKRPGKIQVSWSRLQRRFNGTWREGDDCFGELSLRLADKEIRGARTTDPKSKVDPATPRLADFVWKRVEATAMDKGQWSFARDFSRKQNPNRSWSYGWTRGSAEQFTLLTKHQNHGFTGWFRLPKNSRGVVPAVAANDTKTTLEGVAPGEVNMHPGPTGEHAVSRWTAPRDGHVSVRGRFGAGNPGRMDVHVFHNGKSLFSVLNTEKDEPFTLEIEVRKGDTIDLDVGAGRNGYIFGATPVEAAISWNGAEPGGVAWVTGGPAGNSTALEFDGKMYVDVSKPTGLPTGMSARTLAAWFKFANADVDSANCIVGYGPNWPGRRCALAVRRSQVEAEFCRRSVTGRWKCDSQWHHLAAVVPEQCAHVNQVVVYLDGVRVTSPAFAYQPGVQPIPTLGLESFDTGSGPLTIGAIPGPIWDSSLALKGCVSEVRIYDRALSADEIAVLHSHPARATDRGLVAGYHLDEGRGTTVTDFSGHGNTGTLQRGHRNRAAPAIRGPLQPPGGQLPLQQLEDSHDN